MHRVNEFPNYSRLALGSAAIGLLLTASACTPGTGSDPTDDDDDDDSALGDDDDSALGDDDDSALGWPTDDKWTLLPGGLVEVWPPPSAAPGDFYDEPFEGLARNLSGVEFGCSCNSEATPSQPGIWPGIVPSSPPPTAAGQVAELEIPAGSLAGCWCCEDPGTEDPCVKLLNVYWLWATTEWSAWQ